MNKKYVCKGSESYCNSQIIADNFLGAFRKTSGEHLYGLAVVVTD